MFKIGDKVKFLNWVDGHNVTADDDMFGATGVVVEIHQSITMNYPYIFVDFEELNNPEDGYIICIPEEIELIDN